MAKPGATSRERILVGAADMISRRGLNATSIRELAKHAKAPLGSTYHFFPEGKQQLATEAVRHAGEAVARILRTELDAGPVAGLRAFLALWRGIVVDSDFRAGCPVLAVSVEEPPSDEIPPALVAAAEAFEGWERLLTDALTAHGADPDRAPGLAALVVASVEGAIAMCRAKRSMEPLDQVAQQLETLITGALERPA
ncbi:TetR/AcrR family transcriptional regulator [Streptomyces roseochromogenus]|uniref:TetR family transcriptional regulator n=1 Tax=Streptomyces roseochromogenus subsp. oscitans DS 12.976 TaxID=1352936 RepID=V6KW72_STRRC|nr:TetR/AcrR family transcriptional regulator [Streptomyces roseochromogenus]EST36387.1 TetR family transcriptional regulator [Streptomyces roseochromogenus subsp. oscitans DS 12.976]